MSSGTARIHLVSYTGLRLIISMQVAMRQRAVEA